MLRKNKVSKKIHEVNTNTIAIAASIVILLGSFIFSYNYIKEKKVNAYSYMTNIFMEQSSREDNQTNNDQQENRQEEIIEETKDEPKEEKNLKNYNYIGYLEIPKINLKKGFVEKRSKDNNVEKNIFIVKESNYPDKEKGNFIIAGHSGTGWKAFFKNLYQLEIENEIYVTYKNKKYTYKIADIYTQKKTGTIAIYRDYNKTTLTLVTCTNNDNQTQTVYIAYLEKIENE